MMRSLPRSSRPRTTTWLWVRLQTLERRLETVTRDLGERNGIVVEVYTMEKSIVRRTSCLQSNVDFIQKLIAKNASESHQKLDPAGRAIDDLKRAVAILQKSVSQLQAAEKRG